MINLRLNCGIAVSKSEVESLNKTLTEIERDNEWYEDKHKVLKAELVTSQEAYDELALVMRSHNTKLSNLLFNFLHRKTRLLHLRQRTIS